MALTHNRLDSLGQHLDAMGQLFGTDVGGLAPAKASTGNRLTSSARRLAAGPDLASARGFLQELEAVISRRADNQGQIPDASTVTVTVTTVTVTVTDEPELPVS